MERGEAAGEKSGDDKAIIREFSIDGDQNLSIRLRARGEQFSRVSSHHAFWVGDGREHLVTQLAEFRMFFDDVHSAFLCQPHGGTVFGDRDHTRFARHIAYRIQSPSFL